MTPDRGFNLPEPAETFADAIARLPFDRLLDEARTAGPPGVDRALATPPVERSLSDVAVLLSPSAA